MTTFLLTGKALKTLKKAASEAPEIIPSFDGWYVDIFTLHRRKTVLITHEGTFLSFVCYLTDVGGSKKFVDWFLGEMDSFLIQNSVRDHDRVLDLLSKSSSFHKTRSRKVIGHMTDFKNLIQNGDQGECADGMEGLRKISAFLHDVPVCIEGQNYAHPKKLFLKLLME